MDRRFLALTAVLSALTFGGVLATALPSRPQPAVVADASTTRCAPAVSGAVRATRPRLLLPWRRDDAPPTDVATCPSAIPAPPQAAAAHGLADPASPPGFDGLVKVVHDDKVML